MQTAEYALDFEMSRVKSSIVHRSVYPWPYLKFLSSLPVFRKQELKLSSPREVLNLMASILKVMHLQLIEVEETQ